MSSTLDDSYSLSEITTSGHIVTLSLSYNDNQKRGIWVLVGAAGSSLLAVLVLLTILAISAYKTLRTPSEHRFMRTHVVAYFISLLLCDAISAVGSLMNAYWISRGGVFLGTFCTSQGALKNTGNIGTALWSMVKQLFLSNGTLSVLTSLEQVIAIHTFCLLFLKWRSRDYTLYAALLMVWSFIGLVVIIGQTAIQNLMSKGPYFGVSGYWCWITDGYTMQRVTLEYFWMFLSALVSILLYTIVFLSLRGNLAISGGRLRLRFIRSSSVWESQLKRYSPDGQMLSMAKHMLAYPIAYSALILPIAICRFLQWGGHEISFEVTIFADTVFLLSGLVNAVLFTATRRIVPTGGARGLFSRSKPPVDVESQRSITPFVTSFIPAEKVMPSIEAEREILIVPVAVPALTLPKPLSRGRSNIKRGVSLTATVPSVYSQTPCESNVALPPLPTEPRSKPVRVASIVAPLNVVKTFSLHKAPPDVPVEATEWFDVDDGESYYGLHHHLTSPMRPSPPTPHIPPSTHYKATSSSLTPYQRPQALENWF